VRLIRLFAAFACVTLLGGAAPAPWVFEPESSRIDMSVRAFGGSHQGRFSDWAGRAELDADRPEDARATVTVQAGSLRMSPAAVTGRAIGPGFLDAARHPTIRFELKALEPLGGSRYSARAAITVKGRQRDVAFPVDLRVANGRAEMTGAFTLDRADFGIGTSGPWNGLIGRQVTIRVALRARPA
jgi:polyisoprenoid-binding protein YceI